MRVARQRRCRSESCEKADRVAEDSTVYCFIEQQLRLLIGHNLSEPKHQDYFHQKFRKVAYTYVCAHTMNLTRYRAQTSELEHVSYLICSTQDADVSMFQPDIRKQD